MRADNQTFLGVGWTFPPYFQPEINSAVMSADVDNINQNLTILFQTKIGERIMEYGYGTNLHALIFQTNNTTLLGDITNTISKAILLYEARVNLEKVTIENQDELNGRIDIRVTYQIPNTNSRSNFVFPFYLNEGTNLPYKPEPSAL